MGLLHKHDEKKPEGDQPQAQAQAAQQKGGGSSDKPELPKAAPKAGEGVNPHAREVEHPELEPPLPPAEYRVAPESPGPAPERPALSGGGARPDIEALLKARAVTVRTLDPLSAGLFVGGVHVTRDATEVPLADVKRRGRGHLERLASDPRIELSIATAKDKDTKTT